MHSFNHIKLFGKIFWMTKTITTFPPLVLAMAINDFDLRDDPPKPETEDSEPEDQLVQDEGKIKVFVGSKAPTNLGLDKCIRDILR